MPPEANATPAPYRFHAFERSYFSAKVRPALRYKRLWYEEVRANVRHIRDLTGLTFIPILETPAGEIWQDTSEILDALDARHPDPPLMPKSPLLRIAALLVELYADEFGLLPAMHYRWGSAEGEADARAGFKAMVGSDELGDGAADRMAQARLAIGATDETAPAIEAHMRDLLDALCKHFADRPYLLGQRMSLADCALMGPLYAHLYNDRVSRVLLLETARPVVGWIERCNFPDSGAHGDFDSGDALAPSLHAVLGALGRDAAPAIVAGVAHFEAWADAHPEERARPAGGAIARGVGLAESTFRDIPLRFTARPYSLWMLQRTLDALGALSPKERASVDAAFQGTGWEPVLAYAPRHRLGKRDRQLVYQEIT